MTRLASTGEIQRTVKLSEEYYDYLVEIAGQRKRSLKNQLEVMMLEWMERHGWEAS